MTETIGNLITLAKEGKFDVIAHGVNCMCTMKSGIAPQMAKGFGCDQYYLEGTAFKGNIDKLGNIECDSFDIHLSDETVQPKKLIVVNAYTQYNYGSNHVDGTNKPLDYEALTLCMRKINHKFKSLHIGLPLIGCGLAGGDWETVKSIIADELTDMEVTIVHYDKN